MNRLLHGLGVLNDIFTLKNNQNGIPTMFFNRLRSPVIRVQEIVNSVFLPENATSVVARNVLIVGDCARLRGVCAVPA